MDWEDENIVGIEGQINPELVKPTELPEGPNQEWLSENIQAAENARSDDNVWDTIKSYGERIGIEAGAAATGWRTGQALMAQVPQTPATVIPRLAVPALSGAIGGVLGKKADVARGNVLPGDEGWQSDVLAGAGGMIGSSVPGIAAAGARQLVRKETTEAAEQATRRGMGYTPGTVSESRMIQGLEQRLKEFPFTKGNLDQALRAIHRDFGAAINRLTDDATLGRSPIAALHAGEAIIESAGRKAVLAGDRSNALYRAVNALMPKSQSVQLTKTQDFLATYAGEYGEEYAQLQKVFGDNLMGQIETALKGHDELPWHVLDQIRQQVGRRTAGAISEAGDPKLAQKLYGKILDDMETAAVDVSQDVRKAWRNARRYWRRAYSTDKDAPGFVSIQLAKVQKTDPEKLLSDLQRGIITKIAQTRKASDPETWSLVQSEIAKRMGRAPGLAQEVDEFVFSPKRFLQSFLNMRTSDLESKALKLLFGSTGKYRNILPQLTELARVSQRLAASGKLANPSGTSQALMTWATVGGLIGGGMVDPLTTTAVAGGLYGGSRLWTNKRFLDWLIRGKDVSANTRMATNWVASMPTFAGMQWLGAKDEDALENLKNNLWSWAESAVPSVPGLPVAQ